VLLNRVVSLERSGKILRIKPAAYVEHIAMDSVQVRSHIARLPVVVKRVMPDVNVENGIMDQVCKRSEIGAVLQEKVVPVFGSVIKHLKILWRKIASVRPDAKEGRVQLKLCCQHERAIVVGIVAAEQVGDGRLRGSRLDCGMRVDD